MSSIVVPVVLIDPQGRRAEASNVAIDATQIYIGIGPIGCFLFDKTEEKDPLTGASIFKQRVGTAPESAKVALVVQ